MDPILSSILFGVLGGFVRALVGIVKYFEKNRKDGKFRFGYFAFTIFVAALVGGLAGALANGDWRLAAGGDCRICRNRLSRRALQNQEKARV